MNESNGQALDLHVARWLADGPGYFSGTTHDGVLRKAWADCGVACDVATFSKLLFNRGFAPAHDSRRDRWRLVLPEPMVRG